MPMISLRQLLDHAAEYGYGMPAFNINNMEQILAVMHAAKKTNSPVIIQTSKGARGYAGDPMIRHMAEAAAEMFPDLPICLHQDHGSSVATCVTALANTYTSVMMDGSLQADGKTPSSYDYNVEVSRQVAEFAHMIGASVESELGVIGSLETGKGAKEDGHGFEGTLSKDKLLTDPDQAFDFVKKTNIDALAVAIGTSHGAYKFTRKPDGAILSIDTIKKIHAKLPTVALVMHGSSSVPQELQDMINEYGGKIPQTYGVPIEEIQEGIKYGVRKVNVDTDCRMAMTGAIRKIFATKPDEFDVRKYMGPAMDEMQKVCEIRYEQFGAAGMASKIKAIPLSEMAKRYASGELDHKLA